MSDNVDTTFIHRRRAQIFAKLNSEFGPIEAGSWLNNNVPEKERNTMFYNKCRYRFFTECFI